MIRVGVLGVAFTLLVVNHWWANKTGFPFVVCWMLGPLYGLMTSWLTFAAVFAVAYLFITAVFVRKSGPVLAGVSAVGLVFFIPDIAKALLWPEGSSCW